MALTWSVWMPVRYSSGFLAWVCWGMRMVTDAMLTGRPPVATCRAREETVCFFTGKIFASAV